MDDHVQVRLPLMPVFLGVRNPFAVLDPYQLLFVQLGVANATYDRLLNDPNAIIESMLQECIGHKTTFRADYPGGRDGSLNRRIQGLKFRRRQRAAANTRNGQYDCQTFGPVNAEMANGIESRLHLLI